MNIPATTTSGVNVQVSFTAPVSHSSPITQYQFMIENSLGVFNDESALCIET